MRFETKTADAQIVEAKAAGDKGTATALVSVFGNVDLGGDRMMPGAFTDTLAAWAAKGDPIPVIWNHDWDSPESYVGWADAKAIQQTDQGLVVPMVFDLDRARAEQVFHLMKTRRVTQFSFGYFATDYTMVDDPTYGQVRELNKVELFEVGPTLRGMNPEVQLLEAASALGSSAKAGRVLSAKNEALIASAHQALADVLSTLGEGKAMDAKGLEEAASVHPVTPRQTAIYHALEGVVETFGQFDQGTGPDGAHYVPAAANPFVAEGFVCSSCVFFEGPQACEVVGGDIEPAAVCKFWTIPADLLQIEPAPAMEGASADDMGEAKDSAAGEPAAPVAGDTGDTIDAGHLIGLLSRPQHTEA